MYNFLKCSDKIFDEVFWMLFFLLIRNVFSIMTKEQCWVIIITIYCENEVLKNNNNNRDLIPVSTSSRISQQVNTKTCLCRERTHKIKEKKQWVWDSLTNVRGFVYYVPLLVVEGKSDLDIVQHPCYSWNTWESLVVGFFLLLFTHRGWSLRSFTHLTQSLS